VPPQQEQQEEDSRSTRRRRCGPGLLVEDEEEEDDDVEVVVVAVAVGVVAAAIAWEGNPGRRWVARVLFGRSIGSARLPKNRIVVPARARAGRDRSLVLVRVGDGEKSPGN
jgi:hypothetical protein